MAADVLDGYPDGVWLAELAALADPAHVPGAVASALGMTLDPVAPPLVHLVTAPGTKQMLLVLDNCEHLVAACAELSGALLRACPGVRVLATSREALGIAGERAWRVPSLPAPDAAARTVSSGDAGTTATLTVDALTQYD